MDAPLCIVGSLTLAGPWVEAHGSTTATRLDHSADLVAISINFVRFDERSQEHQIIFCYSRTRACNSAPSPPGRPIQAPHEKRCRGSTSATC